MAIYVRKYARTLTNCKIVGSKVLKSRAVRVLTTEQVRVGSESKLGRTTSTMRLMEFAGDFQHPSKAPKSFTRSELIRSIHERFQRIRGAREEEGPRLRRRAQVESLVIAVLDEIAGALERGMRVELRGIGVLTVKEKRGRQGRNPRTGEALVIDPHRVVRFRVSELLLTRLNQPISRTPEHAKSDSRRLAFAIDGNQKKRGKDVRTGPTSPRPARGQLRGGGIIYEEG
jgi:nucleoid DNA-binding protein